MLAKVKQMLLALNIQGYNIVLTTVTNYSRRYKRLYNSYRLTLWKKSIVDHKAKHKPIYNQTFTKLDIVMLKLIELLNTGSIKVEKE